MCVKKTLFALFVVSSLHKYHTWTDIWLYTLVKNHMSAQNVVRNFLESMFSRGICCLTKKSVHIIVKFVQKALFSGHICWSICAPIRVKDLLSVIFATRHLVNALHLTDIKVLIHLSVHSLVMNVASALVVLEVSKDTK